MLNMTMINIESNYERITVRCPKCKTKNVYSRVSDLGTVEPIDHLVVQCRNPQCMNQLAIGGDSINPAYQMLLLDCYALREERRLMYCMLNICQAYEMFFSLYFRVELIYRPFSKSGDIKTQNALLSVLSDHMQKFTFPGLRCNFLRRVLGARRLLSLDAARNDIDTLDPRDTDVTQIDLAACQNRRLKNRLELLKSTDIHKKRNMVVHDKGYRPKVEEVNHYLDEAEEFLFTVPSMLKIYDDDVNLYRNA